MTITGRTFAGDYDAQGLSFAIILSRFNDLITARLLDGARESLLRHGADPDRIDVLVVPGAFEIPQAAARAAASGQYRAIICLGAVIRGATPHFDYIAAEAARGIAEVGRTTGIPVCFGVITAETLEQALDRAGGKVGNRGSEAALAAIEMARLFEQLQKEGIRSDPDPLLR
ncbi:MAG: 6,7-dimethyl-8-ribityllumazine synthase [Candidatus Methylomirabilales bacterium]